MHNRPGQRIVIAGWLSASAVVAFAHHSVNTNFFLYEESPLELQGRLTEVEIRNPHSLITIDVTEADGKVVEWLLEWSDGNALRRRGVAVEQVTVGEMVTVHARSHRRLPNVAFIRDLVLADGTVLQDCGFAIYRGEEYYATCAEAAQSGD